jgi:hypothetical protein
MKRALILFIFVFLAIKGFAQPANNACASAINLGTVSTTTTTTGTDVAATADQTSPSCHTYAKNVWYKFTVPAAGGSYSVGVNCGTMVWPTVTVFSGSCGSFTEVACDVGGSTSSVASANCLTAGAYYISVDEDIGTAGTFSLTVTQTSSGSTAAANDACASAVNLGTAFTTTMVAGNNSCATADNDVASCFTANNNLWYKFTTGASAGYTATFTVATGGLTDPVISIFSGTCGAFTEVTCQNPFTTSGPVTATASCLLPNTTYYVEVDDDFGTAGTFSLTTKLAATGGGPANDACTAATNLGTAFTTTTVAGNNSCATVDNDVANCFSASNNVWYKFTTGAGAGYVATFTVATGTLTYPVIAVFSGSCGAFTGINCSNPFSSSGPITATATCLTPNTTYYVEVDDDFGTAGTFSLTIKLSAGISGAPSNDDCNFATNLGTAFTNTAVAGNSTCATADNDVASCFTANQNVWYKFTTGASSGYVGTFTVTTGTLTYPTINVYSGTCATLSEMSGGCKAPGTVGTITHSVTCLAPNTTYYVEVDADNIYTSTGGTFTLTTNLAAGTGVPTNDNCTGATNLGTAFTTTTVASTNACASVDNDIASCFSASNNVWYKFTTGASFTTATFTLTTPGTSTNLHYPVLAVFSGSCGAFTEQTCSDPFTVAGPVTATASCLSPNTTYYVEVDDDFGTAGTFSLTTKLSTIAVSCSGSPSGGTISPATNTLTCLPESQSFSLSGNTTGCGITYQWQTSANNSTWTNVTGETNPTYTDPSISTTTYVRCVVTCNNTTSSSSATSTISVSSTPGVNGSATCSSAPVVTNGVGCGDNTTVSTTDPGYWPSLSQFTCDGSIDNLIFEQFLTDNVGGTVNLVVSNIACVSGEGVQAALFDPTAACTATGWGTALFCYNGSDLTSYTLTMTGLLPNHTYWLVYDGYAGAQCTWGTGLNGNVVLPVEIISFSGALNSGNVNLKWTTASETNNAYFTIEKSNDAVHFEELTRVQGKGNSTSKVDYSIIDYFAYSGVSYYRLSQTDYNGKRSENFLTSIINTSDDGMFTVVPNPTDGIINISYDCEITAAGVLNIYNSSGLKVVSKEINCTSGTNRIQVDLGDNTTGVYFVTFSMNDKFYTKKLLKK